MQKSLLLFFLFLASFSTAQELVLLDAETQEPLSNVIVSSPQINRYTYTTKEGKVRLDLFNGCRKVVLQKKGYATEFFSYDALTKESNVLLSPLGVQLGEHICVGTRWRQKTSDIPAHTSTIKQKQIQLYQPQTAADVLTLSGKVFVQKSQQGGGSPMIRGYATNRLLYVVDGVRMNTAIFRGGNIQNVISLDPFALRSAEVLFGPSSVVYGSDAIGGIMSFKTLEAKRATKENQPLISGKTTARYSSANNEFTGHFDANVGYKKWAFLSSFSHSNFGDLRQGEHGPNEYLQPFHVKRINNEDVVVDNADPLVQTPSGYKQYNFMQKVAFQAAKNWLFNYAFHYSTTSDYGRYDRHQRTKKGKPFYGEWSYGPQKWTMNRLEISTQQNHFFFDKADLRLAQQSFEESRITRKFNQENRTTRTEKVNAYSVNLDFKKNIGTKNTFFYGVEGVINTVDSKAEAYNLNSKEKKKAASRYPNSDWASYGLYLVDSQKLSSDWRLEGGIRYNLFTLDSRFTTDFYPLPFTKAKLTKGAVSGSLGAVFQPEKNTVIKANLTTGFRSPNVDDIGKIFDSEPGLVVVPNPNLQPEYVYSADLGVAKVIGSKVKIELNGFYSYLDKAIVRSDFQLNGKDSIVYDHEKSKIQALQNASFGKTYGLQASLEWKIAPVLTFSSDFNWQKGEEELENKKISPARHAAPWMGTSRLTFQKNKIQLQLYAYYCGEVAFENLPESEKKKAYIYAIDKNGNPYSPSWITLNVKTAYRLSPVFTVYAGVENLTDLRYRPYSSGISAPGRNLSLSVQAKF